MLMQSVSLITSEPCFYASSTEINANIAQAGWELRSPVSHTVSVEYPILGLKSLDQAKISTLVFTVARLLSL